MVEGSDVAYARNTEIELFRLYSYTPHATSDPLSVNLNSRFHHQPPPIRHKTNYRSRVTKLVRCVFQFALMIAYFNVFWFYFDPPAGEGKGRAAKQVLFEEASQF